MKKAFGFLVAMSMMILFVVPVMAETDYDALKVIDMVKDGAEGSHKGHDGILRSPAVSGTLAVDTIAEKTAAAGVTVDSLLIKDGSLQTPPVSLGAITNGAVISATTPVITVAPLTVSTNTIANPLATGRFATIVNVGTNAMTLADSGNLKLSSAAVLGQYDGITLLSIDTSIWVEIDQQDN